MKASCCCSPSATAAAGSKWGTGWSRFCPTGWPAAFCARCGPRCRQGDYGDAMMAAAETMGSAIAKAKNVELAARLPRRTRPAGFRFVPLAGADCRRLFPAAVADRAADVRGGLGILPWLILGNVMGGGRGGRRIRRLRFRRGFGGFGGGRLGWRRRFQQLVRTISWKRC